MILRRQQIKIIHSISMIEKSYCEDCGSKVFNLGCVNCDEENYISEQELRNSDPEVYETHKA